VKIFSPCKRTVMAGEAELCPCGPELQFIGRLVGIMAPGTVTVFDRFMDYLLSIKPGMAEIA
jgi:hypothetical protein